jgi:glycosyltransferase involved in cell wall biosynthesis
MSNLPKVTFGFVNCNRLFYLKSCVESFLHTTRDYENKEIIIVDNASIEPGTTEYLDEKEKQGIKVIKNEVRNPANEYAIALNTIVEKSTGDFIAPCSADMQFIVEGGWLHRYVECMAKNTDKIGHISFDAQRTTRNNFEGWGEFIDVDGFKFRYNTTRNPVMGAANCFFSKQIMEKMYPWEINNSSHEGGQDSETKMLNKINSMDMGVKAALNPIIPVSIGIYNEQGTNARVRNNVRIGHYFEAKETFKYYKIFKYNDVLNKYKIHDIPVGIEEISKTIGWQAPMKENGEWLKLSANDSNNQIVEYIDGINPNKVEGSTWFNV